MPIIWAMKLVLPLVLAFSVLPLFGIQEGLASWYGGKFHGRTTSSGETFDTNEKTAAHRTLPFGAIVKVVNLDNGKSTVVKINDRGPFVAGRIIDLSRAAAEELGMVSQGVARVSLEVLDLARTRDLYAIQVGAYSRAGNADNARRRVEEAGFAVFFEKNAAGITRVLVRGLPEKDVPDAVGRLRGMGFTSLVVRKDREETEGQRGERN
jgi:rare lipoprotein A